MLACILARTRNRDLDSALDRGLLIRDFGHAHARARDVDHDPDRARDLDGSALQRGRDRPLDLAFARILSAFMLSGSLPSKRALRVNCRLLKGSGLPVFASTPRKQRMRPPEPESRFALFEK